MASRQGINKNRFLLYHFIIPLAVFLLFVCVLELTDLDVWLAGHFYDRRHNRWPYRDHWLTQTVIHKGGRYLVYGLGMVLLGSWLYSFHSASRLRSRRPLAYLLAASVTGPAIITYLKSHTHIHCPWNLTFFGGNQPYVRLLDTVSENSAIGHCFPSGHSVLGFTFVSLYFFFLAVNPRYRFAGLSAGLLLGFLFGIDQQIRGAHFLSHDIFSLAVCWFSALLIFMVFFRKQFSS